MEGAWAGVKPALCVFSPRGPAFQAAFWTAFKALS